MGVGATTVRKGKPRLQGLQGVLLEPKSGPRNSTPCLAGLTGQMLSFRPQVSLPEGRV